MSEDNTEQNKDNGIKESQSSEDIQALKHELEQLRNEKKQWSAKDQSLNDKVKNEREDNEKKSKETKQLESALTFNLTSADFLKANEAVLPKEIGDIFQMAEREKYENSIQKANATKAAIVQSFFGQQSNVDLLTDLQKSYLADYLKLTKNGKEDKAKEIYDNLFEPALSTLKRVKKAEELSRSKMGYRDSSKGDAQYKEKLMQLSRKHYLGENK